MMWVCRSLGNCPAEGAERDAERQSACLGPRSLLLECLATLKRINKQAVPLQRSLELVYGKVLYWLHGYQSSNTTHVSLRPICKLQYELVHSIAIQLH